MQEWTRRRWLHTAVTAPLGLMAVAGRRSAGQPSQSGPASDYGAGTLPVGIRSRVITGVNGIAMHVLEAGYDPPGRPGLLLVHGFPELGYSWRKVMLPLARGGLPRDGAGSTWLRPQRRHRRDVRRRPDAVLDAEPRARHDGADLRPRPSLAGRSGGARLRVSGRRMVRTHAPGHLPLGRDDECTLRRHGAAAVQYRQRPASHRRRRRPTWTTGSRRSRRRASTIRPTTRPARRIENMWRAPQGLHAFLRAYYHAKSADWPENTPFPLAASTAGGVRQAAALLRDGHGQGDGRAGGRGHADGRSRSRTAAGCRIPSWRCTAAEYGRTGFQGGLQSYRVGRVARLSAELQLFAGRTIDVPATFISGKSDWGVFQRRGQLRGDAEDGVHEVHRHAPDRRRRTLGAAGAAGAGGGPGGGVPAPEPHTWRLAAGNPSAIHGR